MEIYNILKFADLIFSFKINNYSLKKYKYLILFIYLIIILIFSKFNNIFLLSLNQNNKLLKNIINLSYNKKIKNKIRIAIYGYCIINGGRARVTSLLASYFYKVPIFKIFLFTVLKREAGEYIIPNDIKRFVIKNNLIQTLKKNKIDIIIYELDNLQEIELLNNLKRIKVIFYHHSSNFDWLYSNFTNYKEIYRLFKNSKYFISIIPFENNYLFKKWGIRSILMNNLMTYEYNIVIPSNLSSNTILMIGRGQAKKKRFKIGIQSMEFIIQEIPNCKLKIISDISRINNLMNLVNDLNLFNNINFIGFKNNPEIYFRNASLNIFPSISEAFPMVIIETKIFGLPNILLGLDYIAIAEQGNIIIYDDSPESIAMQAIKVLRDHIYKTKLGKDSRNSMKKFKNNLIIEKWIELILAVYIGDEYYLRLRKKTKTEPDINLINILEKQLKLLRVRMPAFINISINEYENLNLK